MLTKEQKYILSLIRQSFGQSEQDITFEDIDLVAEIILRNGILLTVYPAIQVTQNGTPKQLKRILKDSFFEVVRQVLLQVCEGEQIIHALSEAGFDCIALKGWELRKLYPETTGRQMADLDLLVRPYNYKKIKQIMNSLEYQSDGDESSWKHDNFIKDTVTVEIHKRLSDDSRQIQAWEKKIWEKALPTEEEHILKMTPEDFYIFHFIHLYEDFKNGSLGLRRIIDTWLLCRQPVDMSSVRSFLESINLWRFHERMVNLAAATMGGSEITDDMEILLKHSFKFGIYGTSKSYKTGRIAAMSSDGSMNAGKVRSAVAAVFLPYDRMKAQFPILQKYPLLLPACWIKRITRFLREDLKKRSKMLDYSSVNQEDYEEMKQFFRAGGIM